VFRPNQKCVVRAQDGHDINGMPNYGKRKREKCAIVRLKIINDKSSVRADSSASRGNSRELEADAFILMAPDTTAEHDAIIELLNSRYRVMGMNPRFAISGRLDHYEVLCTYWSEA